jgi:hypothetical protein
MSYIPKYILKRMIPKDAVKAVAGGVEITAVNVISPISVDEVPDDVINYLEVEMDGVKISENQKKGLKIFVAEKEYNLANAKDLVGQTIPVGATIKIFAPVVLEKGSTHKVNVVIKTNNPINIEVEREVC